ncbi:MAG TPA: metallophosphoesterase [Candidatus Aquicultoraceae bacterium]|nr:metallophosphoesterase [Candidatus Aquicultoraceae bacterium]
MGGFLYVTDLHGDRRKYERTLALAVGGGFRLVVNGGDMFPHGRMHEEQKRFLLDFLEPHLAKYRAAGIRHLGLPANDDLRVHDSLFDEVCSRHPPAENIAGRRVRDGPFEILGFNLVSDFPFRLKDRARMDSREFDFPAQPGSGILSRPGGWEEIPDWKAYARALPTIEDELAALPVPDDAGNAVYVIHGPPAGMGLDVVRGGLAVGSPATARFIGRIGPRLTLHGHIHESPEESGVWMCRTGATVCIQPGQSASGLTVVAGDLETMTFERRVVPLG